MPPASRTAHSDIHWAPRVKKADINRLYQRDALGIVDEQLIEQVGTSLAERCRSFIDAVHATRGRARCHRCGQIITHSAKADEVLRCGGCDWSVTWREYFATIQHRQLSGAEPVLELFQRYVDGYEREKDPRRRMILIDQVLHGFHWFAAGRTHSRPTAVNLIEGRMTDVIAFLDSLTYGPASTPGLREQWSSWHEQMHATLARWRGPE